MHGRVWTQVLLAALACNEPARPIVTSESPPTQYEASWYEPVADERSPSVQPPSTQRDPLGMLPCAPWNPRGACTPGYRCSSSGSCIADGTCLGDDDCGDDHQCVTRGVCLPSGTCEVDADCDEQLCAAAGVCIDDGDCIDERDCPAEAWCGVLGQCLESGECGATIDCTPGNVCAGGTCEPTGVECTTNVEVQSGCNDYEITCCPAGESCCSGRDRCSGEGTCILYHQCLSDADCLAGFGCVEFACASLEPCDCDEGEYCSAAGACIPVDRCASDLDCPSDSVCTAEFKCQVHPEAACGGCYASVLRAVSGSPNIALVVDRSRAMNACGDETTWWEVVREGVGAVTDRWAGTVHLGLSTFPADCPEATCDSACSAESCVQGCAEAGAPDWPAALFAAVPIQERLALLSPAGERVTDATLRAIAASPASYGLADPERANVVLLITSGVAAADAAAIDELAALETPVVTHEVRVGAQGATSSDQLSETLGEIVRALIPCTFPVLGASVRVYLDDGATLASVPMDTGDGWAFDATGETFTLHGEACDRVRSGQVTPVLIGCHLCE